MLAWLERWALRNAPQKSADDVLEGELKAALKAFTDLCDKAGRRGLFVQFTAGPKGYRKRKDGTERFWDWRWTITVQRRRWEGNGT